jgi:integrase
VFPVTLATALESRTEGLTVGEFLAQWLAHVRGRVRPRTFGGYETLLRINAIPRLGPIRLADLGPLDLQGLYAELLSPGRGLSAGTVLNLHLVLTNAFGQAERWGLIARNPAAGAQPPRPERPEHISVDLVLAERLIETASGTRFELPVTLALATGMRRGEILALRWSDIDSDLSAAHVRRTLQTTTEGLRFAAPKTRRSRRSVELPAFVRPYLNRERDRQAAVRASGAEWVDEGLVCIRADGRPINPDTLSSGWYGFCRKRGLPHVRFHDLRHAHATLMLLKGVHPKVVSERLGHASVGITLDTYSHVLPSMQADAVRAFDELFPGAG